MQFRQCLDFWYIIIIYRLWDGVSEMELVMLGLSYVRFRYSVDLSEIQKLVSTQYCMSCIYGHPGFSHGENNNNNCFIRPNKHTKVHR